MRPVCKECFSDKELSSYITSQNKLNNCSFCQNKNIATINIDELLDFFNELFGCFCVNDTHERSGSNSLITLLVGEWSFFSKRDSGSKILNYVIGKTGSIFQSADTKVYYSEDIIANVKYWDTLKDILKWQRRYFHDLNKLEELGWDGFFVGQSMINQTDVLYRARVHHEMKVGPYPTEEMFCPPKDKSSPGRANPIGIPYLYLSDSETTVLHEVRSLYRDEVTVGRFKLATAQQAPILIADFTETPSLYTEYSDKSISAKITSTLLKRIISEDLSEPLRRFNSELDYIPTQFICEYINIIGANGIKFRSSLHNEGNNYVIFDQSLMECIDTKKITVTQVSLHHI